MNTSKAIVSACLIVGLLAGTASAVVNIETVPVGNPGNAADTRYATPGYGSVDYDYRIGRYEVTAGQYAEFLNKVAETDTYALYNTSMSDTSLGSGITQSGASGSYTYSVATAFVNRPVNYVSYWDSCRFANWLNNDQPTGGQGAGTTETGTYTLNGYNGTDGHLIQRNAGAKWAVTSEDEWYKAAYYKAGSANAGYWDYPTSSNSISTTMANYYMSVGHPTDMGSYAYPSPYGTYDQGGNVWEWTEVVLHGSGRGMRGGAFNNGDETLLAAYRNDFDPTSEIFFTGFRVASEVPAQSPPHPGDLNCDGVVNFDDIDPFVTALVSQAVYEAKYPGCPWLNGDIDGNGTVNFDDIGPFVTCLVAGGCP